MVRPPRSPAVTDPREPLNFLAPGFVSLVGAGPGDPELLTLRAANRIAQARLVLHDQLVDPAILALLPPDAERICVGKAAGCHSYEQQAIIELMLGLALAGRPLLRLKGGDPYIFGRGGEEAQALAAAGVPFEVVPGISAAQAAGALAGIPLTHRDHAQTLVLATGHLRADGGSGEPELDWPLLARRNQTVVIYMGLAALPVISRELMAHGRTAGTPAALVERAARPGMRTLVGTLATLPELAQAQGVRSPALIVVGEVVGLRAALQAVAVAEPLLG